MRDFGPIWRDMPKIVCSRTRRFTEWNTETRTEVVPDEIRKLEGDTTVGGGTPFFRKPNALALKGTRAFGNGVVLLTYGRR